MLGLAKIKFVLRFYGPVNPMGSCRARSVYLTKQQGGGGGGGGGSIPAKGGRGSDRGGSRGGMHLLDGGPQRLPAALVGIPASWGRGSGSGGSHVHKQLVIVCVPT